MDRVIGFIELWINLLELSALPKIQSTPDFVWNLEYLVVEVVVTMCYSWLTECKHLAQENEEHKFALQVFYCDIPLSILY